MVLENCGNLSLSPSRISKTLNDIMKNNKPQPSPDSAKTAYRLLNQLIEDTPKGQEDKIEIPDLTSERLYHLVLFIVKRDSTSKDPAHAFATFDRVVGQISPRPSKQVINTAFENVKQNEKRQTQRPIRHLIDSPGQE